MKRTDEDYIVTHMRTKSPQAIASELGIKERKVRKFIEEHSRREKGACRPAVWAPYVLGAIIVIALIVRLAPVAGSPEKMRGGIGQYGDTHLYHRIAYNLCKGRGFTGGDDGSAYGTPQPGARVAYEPVVTRGPLYPVFMCGVYKTLGSAKDMLSGATWHRNWDKVRIVQCLLDASLCAVIYFMVRVVYPASPWPAIVASLLYAFSYYNVYYTRALLAESLTTFLVTAGMAAYIVGLRWGKAIGIAVSGIMFGLASLTRPEYMLFVPLLAGYALVRERAVIVRAIQKAVIISLCAAAVVAPWTMRNYILFKKPIVVATGSVGFNLYLGSFESQKTWLAWGRFSDDVFKDDAEKQYFNELYDRWLRDISAGTIAAEKSDAEFRELAVRRFSRDPAACIWNWIAKAPRLWYQDYIQMYADREASGAFFLVYAAFALLALFLASGEQRALMWPVILLCAYLTAIFLPLHIEPRYSVPAMPSLIGLCGVGIWLALTYLRQGTGRRP